MAARIEFVEPADDPSGEPGSDPGARPGPASGRSGRRRPALLLALVAAVVLGLLVARAVSSGGRHDDAAPSPAPSSFSVSIPVVSGMQAVLDSRSGAAVVSICAGDPAIPDGTLDQAKPSSVGGTLAEENDGARCSPDASACPSAAHGQQGCVTSPRLPRSVLETVRHRFPGARLAQARTETLRVNGHLWYRLLLFTLPHTGTLRVDIVQRGATVPESGERENASGLFSRIVHVNGGLTILVTTGAPTGSGSALTAQFDLAADPGLLALR